MKTFFELREAASIELEEATFNVTYNDKHKVTVDAKNSEDAKVKAKEKLLKNNPKLSANEFKKVRIIKDTGSKSGKGLYLVSFGRASSLETQVVANSPTDAVKKAKAAALKKMPKLKDTKKYPNTFDKPNVYRIKGNEPRAD